MAAADILNPTAGDDLNPDYGYVVRRPKSRVDFQPRNSKPISRQIDAKPHLFDLVWANRPQKVAQQLKQWEHQFESGFFTFRDFERNRYYSGRFADPLDITPTAFEKWTIRGIFAELPKAPMLEYPEDWDNDAVFIEETNDFGDLAVATNGVWNVTANAQAHGGQELVNNGADNVAFAKLQYFGYGFRLFASKAPGRGTCEVSLDGGVIAAALDLSAGAAVGAASVLEVPIVPIGLHDVKVRALATGTVVFDALQVMR